VAGDLLQGLHCNASAYQSLKIIHRNQKVTDLQALGRLMVEPRGDAMLRKSSFGFNGLLIAPIGVCDNPV
jgi:hypothetical protein